TRLIVGVLCTFSQVDIVDSLTAIQIVHPNIDCIQRAPYTRPSAVEVGIELKHRIATGCLDQADTAGRIEVAFGQQGNGVTRLHVTREVGLKLIKQYAVQLLVDSALRPRHFRGAAYRPLYA